MYNSTVLVIQYALCEVFAAVHPPQDKRRANLFTVRSPFHVKKQTLHILHVVKAAAK